MALYMQQLTDMNAFLEIFKTNSEASQGLAKVLSGVAGANNQAGNKNINPASSPMELNNTLEQANGLMGQNLRWDIDAGQMMVQRGGVWSKDENGKDIYIPKTSVIGTYEEYVKDFEGMEGKEGVAVEPMSKKEWEEANLKNTIRLAKYSDLRFAGEEDNTMENDLKAFRAKLIDGAWNKDAKPWYIISGLEKDNFMGKIDSYSDAQFKDFYFGGFTFDYSTNRMDTSAPAYIRLKNQDVIDKKVNADGTWKEGYGPGTKDWLSRLSVLKEQSFVKGSTYRKAVAEDLWKVMESQYMDTQAEYLRNKGNDSFRFNINQGYTMILSGGVEKYVQGKVIETMQNFILNAEENQVQRGWDGQIYSYEDGEFYQGEGKKKKKIDQSTISKNLGLWDYGFIPGGSTSAKINVDFSADRQLQKNLKGYTSYLNQPINK